MKLRILRNIARRTDLLEGSLVDLPDDEAAALLKRGLAEMVEPVRAVPAKATEAVPPTAPAKPADAKPVDGTAEKAAQDVDKYRDKQKKSDSK